MNFAKDLKKFGLSDKEAAIYLAVLGRGPSTVLEISRKSKVARATTYLVLDALMEMGLVSRIEEDSRTIFIAEQPEQLRVLLDKRRAEIEREQGNLDDLLPKLQAFMKSAESQLTAKYYVGVEGLKVIRSEMTMHSQPGDTWLQLSPVDHMHAIFPDSADMTYVRQRKAKRIASKAIISTTSDDLRDMLVRGADLKWAQRKFVDPATYTSASGLTIYRDRIVVVSFADAIGGVVIENASMADMMREMYMLLWKSLP